MVLVAVALLVFGLSGTAAAGEREAEIVQLVEGLDEDELIVFEPDDAQYTVTVFTDVNCPYCREFHQQIDDYLLWDIRIRYAAFPVIGNAFEQMEAVWCSDDRQDAITRAKLGETIKAEDCPNPVADHLAIAREQRFRGTPTIITPQGRIRYGLASAAELVDMLEAEAAR
ncbi:DsbC family protein [Thioalkalivibrio sp. K90mix]|uniref:DsbC family protein n=1 Tax=Thioalkalivibrio sp. (strain K90mix) TaxID=396595 RepID=UPI000195A614|nr:DsbC family protein [Thioalkalivibrio sp. K90mix]